MDFDGQLKHWFLDDEIPHNLPILDRLIESYDGIYPLQGMTAVMIQHQLGNLVPQAEAIIKLGIEPENIYWIDIPYSSTAQVRNALYQIKIPKRNIFINDYKLLDEYSPYQRLRVQRFIKSHLLDKSSERFLVFDDGSYLIEAMAYLKDRPSNISIVEQTTRGLIKIEDNISMRFCSEEYPIINVARSLPKKTLEPPFIGYSVCDSIRRKLEAAKVHFDHNDRCLVLGYGTIGKKVTSFLTEFFDISPDHIHVSDTNLERMKNANISGFSEWTRDKRDIRFKVVIGCSGRSSFKIGDHSLLEDDAILISATSGSVELSREDFIEMADSSPYDDVWIIREELDDSNIHSDLRFHFIDKEATFVNGGFPVNFDGRINCTPSHYIQPTPTMMVHAGIQAERTKRKGLIDLDKDFCKWLTDEFKYELGEESDILDHS